MYLAQSAQFNSSVDVLTAVRILVEEGQSDPMFGEFGENGCSISVLHHWYGSAAPFLWLLGQNHFEVNIKARISEWRRRSIYHCLAGLSMSCGPRLILDALWRDDNISEINTIKDAFDITVLNECINSLWWNMALGWDSDTFGPEHHYELVQRLLANGSDVHAQDDSKSTPLDVLTRSLQTLQHSERNYAEAFDIDERSRKQRSLIRWWLDTLVSTGFNLHEYGRTEESLHPDGLSHQKVTHPSGCRKMRLSVRTIFSYGKNDDELNITWEELWWEDPNREAFWRGGTDLQDRAHLKMPGSWD